MPHQKYNIKQKIENPKSHSHTNLIAFTLVELIVVIVILAILATIAFLSFSSQSWSARDSTRLSDISSIKKWIEMYNVNSGLYPIPDKPTPFTYSWGTIWNQWTLWDTAYKLIQKTLSKKVTDPLKASEYDYSLASNKREYQVAWNFENSTSFEKNYNPFESDFLISQFSILNSPDANALGWTWVNVYISGNYNWVVLKVQTWSTYYYIPTPTLFWTNSSSQQSITFNNTFGSWTIILPWINNFANYKADQIYSTGSDKLSASDIATLMQKLQSAYSGSNISSTAAQNIISADNLKLIEIWNWLVKNSLWGGVRGDWNWDGIILANNWDTSSNAWTSCNTIKMAYPSSADWIYWIKPNSDPAFQAYCDMIKDWGWWTLVQRWAKDLWSANPTITNSGYNYPPTSLSPSATDNFKLNDNIINSLKSSNDYFLRVEWWPFAKWYVHKDCVLSTTSSQNWSWDCSKWSSTYWWTFVQYNNWTNNNASSWARWLVIGCYEWTCSWWFNTYTYSSHVSPYNKFTTTIWAK
ncbi:MAG: hypothetical protein ACD_3C00014G0008 [uncultured bacterium (gcode 4)]|uniref:Uncharacterized protein n=1 Tax=uncultured bacterium (gcode 4) TaxID=1234023 RepID=K2G0K9_9BACT|nr:MAG: hypothetical protein ACD_3C00014G0008 [uncultured bacterium (gcode 4)]